MYDSSIEADVGNLHGGARAVRDLRVAELQHTTALLERHEAILVETADHAVALEKLRATRAKMFVSVTTCGGFGNPPSAPDHKSVSQAGVC